MKDAQLERASDPDDHLLITPGLHSHHIGWKTQVLHFILIWPVRFDSTTKTKLEKHSAIICHNGTLTRVTWKGHLTDIKQCFGLWMKKLHKLVSHDGSRFVN